MVHRPLMIVKPIQTRMTPITCPVQMVLDLLRFPGARLPGQGANGLGGDRWNRKNYQVGLGYTMGVNDFALTHSRIGSVDKNGASQSNTGAKATTVTWAYNLSKRTALNLSYIQLANDSAGTHGLFYNGDTVVGTVGSSALAGEKHSALSMGMRYAF